MSQKPCCLEECTSVHVGKTLLVPPWANARWWIAAKPHPTYFQLLTSNSINNNPLHLPILVSSWLYLVLDWSLGDVKRLFYEVQHQALSKCTLFLGRSEICTGEGGSASFPPPETSESLLSSIRSSRSAIGKCLKAFSSGVCVSTQWIKLVANFTLQTNYGAAVFVAFDWPSCTHFWCSDKRLLSLSLLIESCRIFVFLKLSYQIYPFWDSPLLLSCREWIVLR